MTKVWKCGDVRVDGDMSARMIARMVTRVWKGERGRERKGKPTE